MTVSWGTLAYGLTAGFSAGIGLLLLIFAARSRRADRLMIAFGVYGLVTATATLITLDLHTSSTIVAYNATFRLFGFASLISIVSVVFVVEAWTNAISRSTLAVFGVATVFIGVLQSVLPSGLLIDEVVGLRTVELFGESFAVHEGGGSSPWRPVLDLYLLATLAMIVLALVRRYRRGDRVVAALVSLGMAIGLVFGAYDSLVDAGVVNTTYLGAFGQTFMVIGAGAYLADCVMRAEAKLHEGTLRLEETVIERTAALIDANDRLEFQLAQQRRSADSLTNLTQEFEASNAIVEPSAAETGMTLQRLLGRVGSITTARAVELRILDPEAASVVPGSIIWKDPGPPDGPGAEPYTVREDVGSAGRAIGELVAYLDHTPSREQRRYVDLAAEHLAGLILRLELVGKVTDSAIEGERHRIAMDLHDSVTQQLYSVSFLADAAVHMVDDEGAQLAETIRRLRGLVLSSIAELRSLLYELQPSALDDVELGELLAELASSMSSSDVDVDVDLHDEPVPALPPDVKLGLYRIAQEAVNNACRHSDAEAVSIALHHDDGVTTLVIADDGVGFSPADSHSGSGLDNIESRAVALGATFDIASTLGIGTTVTARWAQHSESVTSFAHGASD